MYHHVKPSTAFEMITIILISGITEDYFSCTLHLLT
jgi:hypothetical protein